MMIEGLIVVGVLVLAGLIGAGLCYGYLTQRQPTQSPPLQNPRFLGMTQAQLEELLSRSHPSEGRSADTILDTEGGRERFRKDLAEAMRSGVVLSPRQFEEFLAKCEQGYQPESVVIVDSLPQSKPVPTTIIVHCQDCGCPFEIAKGWPYRTTCGNCT